MTEINLKIRNTPCLYELVRNWALLLLHFITTLSALVVVNSCQAAPYESNWSGPNANGAFSLANRRGPNPIYSIAPVNPGVGLPSGRLESDGGSANGNVHLDIPLVNLPGRGSRLTLSAQYNSQIWSEITDDIGTSFTYDVDGDWPVPGLNLGLGKLVFPKDAVLVEPNGTRRPVGPPKHEYVNGSYTGRTTAETLDGSGTTIECPPNTRRCSAKPYIIYVHGPNGTTTQMISASPGVIVDARTYYPLKITDAHGNSTTISYRMDPTGQPMPPYIDRITDTVGRTIDFHYDARNLPIAITGPGQNGTRRTFVRFYYHQHTAVVKVPQVLGRQNVALNFPVLHAVVFPDTGLGYLLESYSPHGLPRSISKRRGMLASTISLTEQGTFAVGRLSSASEFDYPDDPQFLLRRKTVPRYSSRTDRWDDPVSGSVQTATTRYDVQDNCVTTIAPDGMQSIQCNDADSRLVDFVSTIASDGHWLETTQYIWEPGEGGIMRQREVRRINHEANIVASTEYRYGRNNMQITDEILHEYSAPDKINQAPIKLHTVRQYLSDERYLAKSYNLVTMVSLFNGKTTVNPAYAAWQQQLTIAKMAVDQALQDAAEPQQYLDAAQLAYDTENANEPPPLIDNPRPPPDEKENPYHDTWAKRMAKLKSELDQAKKDAEPTERALAAAQAAYNDILAVQPLQTLQVETARTTFEYDSRYLLNLTPKPVNYSPISDSSAPRGLVSRITRWLAPDALSVTEGAARLHGIESSYTYDEAGNLREERVSPNTGTTYIYRAETQYSLPASVTFGSMDPSSDQHVTVSTTYDLGTGNPIVVADAIGNKTRLKYTAGTSGWRISSIQRPTGVSSSYKYRDFYLTVESSLNDVEGRRYFQATRYDGRGLKRDVRTRRRIGGGHDIDEYRYDAIGRVVQSMATNRTSDPSPKRWTTFAYDSGGRLTTVKDPTGNVSSLFYNEQVRPAAAHDLLGTTIRAVDSRQRENWSLIDAFGRTRMSVLPDPHTGKVSDAGSSAIAYEYDEQGRTIQISQAPQMRAFRYDSLGRLAAAKVPERSATLDIQGRYRNVDGLYSDVYFYDDMSNMIEHTDPRGAKTVRRYSSDPLNRLQEIGYDLTTVGDKSSPIIPSASTSIKYMQPSKGDPRKILSILTQGTLQVDNSYDSFGRLATTTWNFPSLPNMPLRMSAKYDSLGRLNNFTYPPRYEGIQPKDGPRLNIAYSVDGDLAGLDLDGLPVLRNIDTSVDGTRSATLANNGVSIVESNRFDANSGRIVGQTVASSTGMQLLNIGYEYKDSLHIAENDQIIVQSDRTDLRNRRRYEYDGRNRLTASYLGPEPPTADTTRQEYEYDSYNNRTRTYGSRYDPRTRSWVNSDELADGISLTVDPSTNRIVDPGFLYDRAGNLIGQPKQNGEIQRYIYDAAERVVRVEDGAGRLIEAYLYGADRRRIGTSSDLTSWTLSVWDDDLELARYYRDSGGSSVGWKDMSIYVGHRLLGELSHRSDNTTATALFHNDLRGVAIATTSSGGAISVTRNTVRPYGTTSSELGNESKLDRQFTSYRRSALTGLDYAVNRQYDSRLGRFTQTDPAASGSNLYAYASNDPINRIDPAGLRWVDVPCKSTEKFSTCVKTVWIPDAVPAPVLSPAEDWWNYSAVDVPGSRGKDVGGNDKEGSPCKPAPTATTPSANNDPLSASSKFTVGGAVSFSVNSAGGAQVSIGIGTVTLKSPDLLTPDGVRAYQELSVNETVQAVASVATYIVARRYLGMPNAEALKTSALVTSIAANAVALPLALGVSAGETLSTGALLTHPECRGGSCEISGCGLHSIR